MNQAVVLAAAPTVKRRNFGQALILAAPVIFLAAFCITPILLLIQMSFAHHDEGGLWSPGFELTQYRALADPVFLRVVGFSLLLAASTS